MMDFNGLVEYLRPLVVGKRALELGGGTVPWIRPNLDVRAGDNVDVVASLEEPLPIPDAECDVVFSKFAAEHISYPKIPQFFAECCRILAPGGVAVIVVPNTLEQARRVVERGDAGDWYSDNGVSCLLFGQQDYDENSHKTAFYPAGICGELREAGFASVMVWPFGVGTDMVVEAVKGA